ncbi:helix-turn-helix domain-containing protein [Streptomyces sp. NPDC060001]|uniref:helix-turn-helix domain-containing protein n=1 Tax=Streptomyces sp. NPDC060001 TaxID=3347032 RepID=UPI0036903931
MSAPVQVGPSPHSGGPVPSPDDLLADIGDRIRAERQARGWSLNELGHRAGLARNTVRRLEEDGVGTLHTFALTCAALGVEMSLLLSDQWEIPERHPSLTVGQVKVLRAVAGGEPLSVAAGGLGMPVNGLASRLSQIYRRLDVVHVPRGLQRRMAAVEAARRHGLFDAA